MAHNAHETPLAFAGAALFGQFAVLFVALCAAWRQPSVTVGMCLRTANGKGLIP